MRVFVAADWMNLEGRLTAHFSGDEALTAALAGELTGGPKVHSINAGLIYDIPPESAKIHMVNLKGQLRQAYDAGKRLTHAWNYGATWRKLCQTFWVEAPFAKALDAKLQEKYPGVVDWRLAVVDQVFGVALYKCLRCKYEQKRDPGSCPRCSRPKRPVKLAFSKYVDSPERELRTPFGRRRLYPGRRKDSANAVISQLPQSCGASMWYRTLMRLHGYDPYTRSTWPVPTAALSVVEGFKYSELRRTDHRIDVVTGTYDSFVIECEMRDSLQVISWLMWTMEQPWYELGGLRIPAEGAVGMNWGKRDLSCRNCGHQCHGRLCLHKHENVVCACGQYAAVNHDGLAVMDAVAPLTAKYGA